MHIKTRLHLNSAVALAVILFTAGCLGWYERESLKDDKESAIAAKMHDVINERLSLGNEYVLQQPGRAKIQWQVKTQQLKDLLRQAREAFPMADRTLLEHIQRSSDAAALIFAQIVGMHEKGKWNGRQVLSLSATEIRLLGQLRLQALAVADSANRLQKSIQEAWAAAHRQLHFWMVIFVGIGVVVTVGNTAVINRLISRRVAVLRKGWEIIGGGHLSHRFQIQGNDELCDLARVSNAMAAQLEESYTSIKSLQREIAERERVQNRLEESEEKYRSIFENTVEGIFQATPEGCLIKINPAMARIHGFTSPEDMMTSITNIGEQLYVEPGDEGLRMLLKVYGAVKNYEAQIHRKDGAVIWVSVNVRAVKDHAGKVVYYEGTVEDISDRKLREREREEAFRKLSDMQAQLIQTAKMAAVGQLASGVAHEIKNPLAIILGGIEYLDSFLAPDPSLREVGEMVKSEALRADKIIKDLLGFSRKSQAVFEETNITSVIDESLSLVERQMGLRNIKIVKDFAPFLPKVLIDPNQIKQVFINLTVNAVDAMMPGGGVLTNRVAPMGDRLAISLSDTGCGILREHLTKIFDPFFTTKEKGKSTGLGLHITRQIIEAHGGAIAVESEPKKGTTFTIELPVAKGGQVRGDI